MKKKESLVTVIGLFFVFRNGNISAGYRNQNLNKNSSVQSKFDS
uniref:Uncharacterized protein n=1 Tax=Anguilla anguilla TaxID=7936 RepID=A0A0E9W542_ANGAN